jgi:hypothetical protein
MLYNPKLDWGDAFVEARLTLTHLRLTIIIGGGTPLPKTLVALIVRCNDRG